MTACEIVIEIIKHQIERCRKCDLYCHTEHLRSLSNVQYSGHRRNSRYI